MKNAAKKWYNYLIALGIVGILFGCAYTPFKVSNGSDWPAKYVCYFMVFSGIVIAGVGFIVQDIYRAVIRHRINDWDNKLDESYLNKAWAIFYPMLTGGILTFVIGVISNLFVK